MWELLASRYHLHGPGDMMFRISKPHEQQLSVSIDTRHLTRLSPSLRILTLKDVTVQGTFANGKLPDGLECLVCVNSTVPFSTDSFRRLRKLKFVAFSNTIDRNLTYEFGTKVKRLRLENPPIETLKFEAGHFDLEELASVKTGKSFQVYCPKSTFSSLRKVVIQDTPSVNFKELPGLGYGIPALQSLSIQGCDQVTELS